MLAALLLSSSLAVASPVAAAAPVDSPEAAKALHELPNTLVVRLAPGARLEAGRFVASDAAGRLQAAHRPMPIAAVGATDAQQAFEIDARHEALAERFGLTRYVEVTLPAGADARAAAAALLASPLVEHAAPTGVGSIFYEPNDPLFGDQYGLHNTGQVIGGVAGVPEADIDATGAWDRVTGDPRIITAIIDTGISDTHPDLVGALVPGFDTVDNDTGTDDSPIISHGTHVAGIVAAIGDNGVGIAGVAYGTRLMPLRTLNNIGAGTDLDVARGIVFAAINGARIANMSLGFPPEDNLPVLQAACDFADAAGVLLVAASGNTPGAPVGPPARYDSVMAVGATGVLDIVANFTTTGPEMSVSAPGDAVVSTWDAFFPGFNSYAYSSGTSMAAPHVAGVAALVLSANPSLTPRDVQSIIESTAVDLGPEGWDETYGHGRVSASAAVDAALEAGCRADFDGDGSISMNDVQAFLNLLATQDPAGDLNEDGLFDVFDARVFLLIASGGC